MMPGAHAHAVLIENRREIVRMNFIHRKTHHATATLGHRPVHFAPRHLRQLCDRVLEQRFFVRAHAVHSKRLEVFRRRTQPDGVGCIGCSGLELVGHHIPGTVAIVHPLNHVTTKLIRRHCFE